MIKDLAKAMLKEIPLGQLEVYLQVLDAGVLRGRDDLADDNGTICGGGCDAKGGACGAWCLFNGPIPFGCFDQFGQAGLAKEDFHAAIRDPEGFRRVLGEEMGEVLSANKAARQHLAPKISAEVWAKRP
jgi:hypothetical protein